MGYLVAENLLHPLIKIEGDFTALDLDRSQRGIQSCQLLLVQIYVHGWTLSATSFPSVAQLARVRVCPTLNRIYIPLLLCIERLHGQISSYANSICLVIWSTLLLHLHVTSTGSIHHICPQIHQTVISSACFCCPRKISSANHALSTADSIIPIIFVSCGKWSILCRQNFQKNLTAG
jgi:hypothetical protein